MSREQDVLTLIKTLREELRQLVQRLDQMERTYVKYLEEYFDPEKLNWAQTEGFRGKYERYPPKGQKPELSQHYKNLLNWIKQHGGKATYQGYFYWVFDVDGATIGRKKIEELKKEGGEDADAST